MSAKKLTLSSNQQLALEVLKNELAKENYSIEEYIIFGSVARGKVEEGSDLDLLLYHPNQLSLIS